MTLVLETPGHETKPHTHVLIIGVGRYKHLIGGDPANVNVTQPPLGQLKSPPISARALADWFTRGEHNNPAAPLGTVELLLSDADSQVYSPPNSGTSFVVDDATMPNIVHAFNKWDARCNRFAGNVALFYFCGHGLQMDGPLLLPEDFAWNPNNPWAGAIDFSRTYNGMKQCLAQTQYYVIDACRNYTKSMLPKSVEGTSLKASDITQLKNRTAPTLYATAQGLPAFGDHGGVSRLTTALLDCLKGSGAEKKVGAGWAVTTGKLGTAVQDLVNLTNDELNEPDRQVVDPAIMENAYGSRDLHVLKPEITPTVVVKFRCQPDDALPDATFYHKELTGVQTPAEQPGKWTTTIPAGIYVFGVTFAKPPYPAKATEPEFIGPPVCPVDLKVN